MILTFCYVSPETKEYAPLTDQYGADITLQVDAPNKTAAIYHADTAAFCTAQGNDCRVRGVSA